MHFFSIFYKISLVAKRRKQEGSFWSMLLVSCAPFGGAQETKSIDQQNKIYCFYFCLKKFC